MSWGTRSSGAGDGDHALGSVWGYLRGTGVLARHGEEGRCFPGRVPTCWHVHRRIQGRRRRVSTLMSDRESGRTPALRVLNVHWSLLRLHEYSAVRKGGGGQAYFGGEKQGGNETVIDR